MTYLFPTYQRKSYELISGSGSYLESNEGKTYLDFTSGIGVMNLGYQKTNVLEALTSQSHKLWHTPNLYQNSLQERVAEKLSQGADYLAFFCNSGAEANEAAIKLARKATGKSKIITFLQSFHGRTFGAMSATGQTGVHTGFGPLVADFCYLPYNHSAVFSELTSDTAAVFLEVIQGEGGVIPAEAKWIRDLASSCHEQGILLIVDEVQTGIGRTGTLYGFQQYGIEPDIFTLAKGLGNGFPVGAMLGKSTLKEAFGPGSHGSTFGGNKLAMAVAAEVLEAVDNQAFLANVTEKGNWLKEQLQGLNTPIIKEVRGQGLMLGIELAQSVSVNQILATLEENQLLALRAGENVLRLLPPLTISKEELNQGYEILKQVLV